MESSIVNLRQSLPLGLMLGQLHVRFFQRASEAAHTIAILANILALGFVKNVTDVLPCVADRLHQRNEILDQLLEENIVFPERVVGVDEKDLRFVWRRTDHKS